MCGDVTEGQNELVGGHLTSETHQPLASPWRRQPNADVSCEYGSNKCYALCGFGGVLSCGLTHTAVVPLDLIKCRIQVDPVKYKSVFNGFSVTLREDGFRGLGKGWAPTFIGYSMQGLCKFGFYEVFKAMYNDMLGEENAYLWRTSVYLAASASAEFFADIALAPMEACKVRIQTQPGYANTLRECAPKMHAEEGLNAFYKGVYPLWLRQIPYTMMKFACFERTVEMLYKHIVPKPRSECSKQEQLVVTFVAGYIAGVFCAVVSHPADSVVSVLNNEKGSSAVEVLKRLGPVGESPPHSHTRLSKAVDEMTHVDSHTIILNGLNRFCITLKEFVLS
ncbi:solute carrier family 25 mitochondrial carrier [Triplophysa rosa]|uniref:Solute carrier family 25 member 3 n=1 Tax=Triplophysa rosa TaxID=992332 RepID=A0A9W7T8J6_TRIRA|nr:solute carrier family 25 mitochondrial carrier [Triplophysa rosa]